MSRLVKRTRWHGWLLVTALTAVAVHVGVVAVLPYTIGAITVVRARLVVNHLYHGSVKKAPRDIVPYDNPHNMSSFVVYDLEPGPLRMTARVPREVPYWSIAVNAYNTDQLAVINDRQVQGETVTLVIVREGASYRPHPGEFVVRSPGRKGFVLVRMLLPARNDRVLLDRLAAIQGQAGVATVTSGS
jgi:uncharacterized membrane protein